MAIPPDINRVFVEGVWRDPDDPDVDVFRWALVFHVEIDVRTNGAADPQKLRILGTEKMNLLIGGGGLFTAIGEGTFCTKRGAVNLATGVGGETEADVKLQANSPLPICSPATSIMVLGRTQSLSHQTRKWVPCVRRDLLIDHVPKWSFSEAGGPAGFLTWCKGLLAPRNYVTIGLGKDVVWDESTETVRQLRETVVQAWPRTIRARVLDAPSVWL